MPIEAVSDGTAEQVLLAARIGLVGFVTGGQLPPLILDDPFAGYDDVRATRSFDLLRQLASGQQIIYLTVVEPVRSARYGRDRAGRADGRRRSRRASLSVVLLGLLAALSWGAGDFGGGIAARRGPLLGIVIVTQFVGAGLTLAVALARAETSPPPWEIGWALSPGSSAGSGILSLYRGLATGRMGVVAPISGVLAAAIPVALGMVLQGLPVPARLAGMVLRLPRGRPRLAGGRRRQPRETSAWASWPASGSRLQRRGVALLGRPGLRPADGRPGVGGAAVRGRSSLAGRRPLAAWPGRSCRWWSLVGALDMGGNAFYILATQAGRLDVATILSSLYPVTTVVLASLLLRERIAGSHLVGVLLAIAGDRPGRRRLSRRRPAAVAAGSGPGTIRAR